MALRRVALALWRSAISVRTALLLMLVLGALALVGAVVEQAPAGAGADPRAHAAWLDSVRSTYGDWTNLLDVVGAFSIFGSIWFRLALGALALSILACSVSRFASLRRVAFSSPVRLSPEHFERAGTSASVESGLDAETALDVLRTTLLRHGFRVLVPDDVSGNTAAPGVGGLCINADKFRFAPFGTLVSHLGLLVILGGVLAGSAWGFRNPTFVVPVGSRADVGNGTGLTVEATGFTDSYYTNGSPSDYATDLVLYRAGSQVAAQTIRVNEPLRYGGVSFYQSFFGPAIVLRAVDGDGPVAFDGGVPLLWTSNDGSRTIGQFEIPGAGLTAYLAATASGRVDPLLRPGQVQLEVYWAGDDTAPIDSATLSQGTPIRVGGLDFTFVRERQYAGLIVARDPGLPLVFGGAALLVTGISLVFMFRARRLWGLVEQRPGGCRVTVVPAASDAARGRRSFAALAADIEAALDAANAEGR